MRPVLQAAAVTVGPPTTWLEFGTVHVLPELSTITPCSVDKLRQQFRQAECNILGYVYRNSYYSLKFRPPDCSPIRSESQAVFASDNNCQRLAPLARAIQPPRMLSRKAYQGDCKVHHSHIFDRVVHTYYILPSFHGIEVCTDADTLAPSIICGNESAVKPVSLQTLLPLIFEECFLPYRGFEALPELTLWIVQIAQPRKNLKDLLPRLPSFSKVSLVQGTLFRIWLWERLLRAGLKFLLPSRSLSQMIYWMGSHALLFWHASKIGVQPVWKILSLNQRKLLVHMQ